MVSKLKKVVRKDRAIVLRTHKLRESDLLVTLLTESFGKATVVARGALRSKKRFMSGIDLFDCALYEIILDADDLSALGSLSSESERSPWPNIRANLKKFQLASLCAELADLFSPVGDKESRAYFAPLKEALETLNLGATDHELIQALSGFLFSLLSIAGYDILSSSRPELIYAARPDAELLELKQAVREMLAYIEDLLGQRLRTRNGITFF